ncbi:MAG: pseudoazurin [Alphaproteobacteria bacterium]|jgi:plastocyanin|nr:pseudoazurin [Alphaproteobacteria bacterium]
MKILNITMAVAIATLVGATHPSIASAGTTIVKMVTDEASGDLIFEPAKINIQPGDTVVWVQADADNEHNVAAYSDKIPEGTSPFVSPMMGKAGDSWVMTFDAEGSYFYHCHPHEAAGMKGLIVVGRTSLPEEFRKPQDGDMSHAQHGDMEPMEMDKHQGDGKSMKMKMENDHGHQNN